MKVIEGDFRKVLKIEPGTADLVLSDPPFGNLFKHTRKKFKGFVVTGDDLDWLSALFEHARTWLKPCAPMVLFCDHKGFSKFENEAIRWGFILVNVAIWNKQHFAIGYNFRPQHEFLMLFSQNRSVMSNNRNLSSVLSYPRVSKKIHPTQKPVALLAKLVSEFSPVGGIVVDPFSGSGSTAIACLETNRKFMGSELIPEYVAMANSRIAEAK